MKTVSVTVDVTQDPQSATYTWRLTSAGLDETVMPGFSAGLEVAPGIDIVLSEGACPSNTHLRLLSQSISPNQNATVFLENPEGQKLASLVIVANLFETLIVEVLVSQSERWQYKPVRPVLGMSVDSTSASETLLVIAPNSRILLQISEDQPWTFASVPVTWGSNNPPTWLTAVVESQNPRQLVLADNGTSETPTEESITLNAAHLSDPSVELAKDDPTVVGRGSSSGTAQEEPGRR